jgi:hypothetical protein
MTISKPVLGNGDYPQIELTDKSTGHYTRRAGVLGLGDVKRFFDSWRDYCNPDLTKALEIIKAFRYAYAFGYWQATQDHPIPETPKGKTYTALEMQNAYREGILRGTALMREAIDQGLSDAKKAFKACEEVFNERRDNQAELEKDADILAKVDPSNPECNCPACELGRRMGYSPLHKTQNTNNNDDMSGDGFVLNL